MIESELVEQIKIMQETLKAQQNKIARLENQLIENNETSTEAITPEQPGKSSRRKLLKGLAAGLVAGVGATAFTSQLRPAKAEFFPRYDNIGGLALPIRTGVTGTPPNPQFGLVAIGDEYPGAGSEFDLANLPDEGDVGVYGLGTRGIYGLSNTSGPNSYGVFGKHSRDNAYTAGVRGEGGNIGVWGVCNNQQGGAGVYGNGYRGVQGVATDSTQYSFGVYGLQQASTGATAGVRGEGGNIGVWGVCPTDASGAGVYGTGYYGVEGISTFNSSSDAAGVRGQGFYNGVRGESTAGGAGEGVLGSGEFGVFGAGNYVGTTGVGRQYGIMGVVGSATDSANYHEGAGNYTTGVKGFGGDIGVWGRGGNVSGIGVYGNAGYWAGYFDGRVHITGTLSKGGGSFKIDHPLDPENKYLSHSFVESPDMMNIYNGVAELNERGEAAITLPDWFEALNRDYRYQLTPLGEAAPNLHISREVSEGRFSIGGGQAGQKISWQVTGIRQDAWANQNRIPLEEDKPQDEQGTYLHPLAFGKSTQMGSSPMVR